MASAEKPLLPDEQEHNINRRKSNAARRSSLWEYKAEGSKASMNGIAEVRRELSSSQADKLFTDDYIGRFLECNEGDPKRTVQHLQEHIWWRENFGLSRLNVSCIEDALNLQLVYCPGASDQHGRPLIFVNMGKYDPHTINRYSFLAVFVYMLERASELSPDKPFCFVLDFSHWTVARHSPQLTKLVLDTLQLHYPGKMGSVILYNIPWFVRTLWWLCNRWMDKKLRDSIHIASSRTIHEFLPVTSIPERFGGGLKWSLTEFKKARSAAEGISLPSSDGSVPPPLPFSDLYLETLSSLEVGIDEILNVLKSGYLMKRGGGGLFGTLSWKRRFFIFDGKQLYYYENQKARKPLRVFLVDKRCHIVDKKSIEGHDFPFILATPTRDLWLSAKSKEDKEVWTQLISRFCDPVITPGDSHRS